MPIIAKNLSLKLLKFDEIRQCKFFDKYHVCPTDQKSDILSAKCSLGQNVELDKIFCSLALGFHMMLTNSMDEMFHVLRNVSRKKIALLCVSLDRFACLTSEVF